MEDFEHIELLKQGDERAFTLLIDRYSKMVFNLSLQLLQNEKDAEDATQEVFTIVFLTAKQFKGDAKLSTWMYRIAINKCQEMIRARSRKKRFGFMTSIDTHENSSVSLTNFQHPGIELENKERITILFSAINKLPENQRIAFVLHKIDGLSYDEIAGGMETSLSSVESLIFRAKQNLKKLLSDYYEENER
ncbi:MAG: sigma-70 family RNA polymerase sigma factor [Bacteroidota bacterium]